MNMKQTTLATAAGLALCFTACAGGHNAPTYSHKGYNNDWRAGWYIGAGVNADANLSNKAPLPEVYWASSLDADGAGDFELETNTPGFDIYVGREVSKHFAFELGYTWMGDQVFEATNTGAECPGCESKITVQQWNAHAVGLLRWPVFNHFDVFAKGGIAYYQNLSDIDAAVPSETTPNAELNTFALTYGAGFDVTWGPVGFRGEYNVISPNESDTNNFYISDVVGASLFYRFM